MKLKIMKNSSKKKLLINFNLLFYRNPNIILKLINDKFANYVM